MNYKLAGVQLYKQALGGPVGRTDAEMQDALVKYMNSKYKAPSSPGLLQKGLASAQKYLGAGVRNLASTPGPLQKPVTAGMDWISKYPDAGHVNPLTIAARQAGGKAFDLPVWNASPGTHYTTGMVAQDPRTGKILAYTPGKEVPQSLQDRIAEFKEKQTGEFVSQLMIPQGQIKPTMGQVVSQAAILHPKYINNKLRLNAVAGGGRDHYDGSNHSLALPSRNPAVLAHELGHASDPFIRHEGIGPAIDRPKPESGWLTNARLAAEYSASGRGYKYLENAGATPEELAASQTMMSRAYDTYRGRGNVNKSPALFGQTPYERAQTAFVGKDIQRQPMNQYPPTYPGGINDQKRLAAFNSQQKQLGKFAPGIVAAADKQPSKWNKP